MSRRRSLWNRYIRSLKRYRPTPAWAMMALALGACGSRPAVSGSVPVTTTPSTESTRATPEVPGELSPDAPDWAPQLLPTELHLTPEFRSACAPFVALPPSLTLNETEAVADVLEPMASCLTLGPLTGEPLHLVGSTELPGRWDAPVHGSGRADQLRSTLSLLGVPFDDLITYDVDSGNEVEVGIAPESS